MSEYVVHFTKETGDGTAYDNSIRILSEQKIDAMKAFGAGRNLPVARKAVCFSEIPLHQLNRLADERGPYGIGFRKELLVKRGGGPILYAYKDSDHANAINSMVMGAQNEPDHPIWKIAPFVDVPGVHGTKKYLYEWEREWRVVGDFTPDETALLIIPEHQHEAARGFFDDAEQENIGPNYTCKFIDPYWNDEQVNSALRG